MIKSLLRAPAGFSLAACEDGNPLARRADNAEDVIDRVHLTSVLASDCYAPSRLGGATSKCARVFTHTGRNNLIPTPLHLTR